MVNLDKLEAENPGLLSDLETLMARPEADSLLRLIEVEAQGERAQEAVDAIGQLIADRFGEDE